MRKIKMDMDSMECILDMGSSRTRFFKWLLSQMDEQGIVRGTVREMSEACRMSQATVTAVFKDLTQEEIIYKIDAQTYWLAGIDISGGNENACVK